MDEEFKSLILERLKGLTNRDRHGVQTAVSAYNGISLLIVANEIRLLRELLNSASAEPTNPVKPS
jgi:hypothetical protein